MCKKKPIILITLLALFVLLTGCGAKTVSNENENIPPKDLTSENSSSENPACESVLSEGTDAENTESKFIYEYQEDFYTQQFLNGNTDITPELILFFNDYFTQNSNELRLLPKFTQKSPPKWEELSIFLLSNIDDWPENDPDDDWTYGIAINQEQFSQYMRRYFLGASYIPNHKGSPLQRGKFVFYGGCGPTGFYLYEITSLEKQQLPDIAPPVWKAHIKGYFFDDYDSHPEQSVHHSDNGKAIWAEIEKTDSYGLSFWDMYKKVLLNDPESILDASVEWTIEFIVNDPLGDLHLTYLSCDRQINFVQSLEPQEYVDGFSHYPIGYRFIESVAHLRGEVDITPELRKLFNHFARNYRWNYLPDVNPGGFSYFGDAVFYMMSYLRYPEKISAESMESALKTLFTAVQNSTQPMPHQSPYRLARYADGYYFSWREDTLDFTRMYFLLTDLKVEEQASGEVYITVRATYYYFGDPSFYPLDENAKWLKERAQELGLSDAETAAKLIAENKMDGAKGSKVLETVLVYKLKNSDPSDYAPRILSNKVSYIQ